MKATLIGAQRDNGYYDDTAVVERAGGAVVELRWLGGVMEERPARPGETYVQLGAGDAAPVGSGQPGRRLRTGTCGQCPALAPTPNVVPLPPLLRLGVP